MTGGEALAALAAHPVTRAVAESFATARVPLFLVGGCVRDALRGSPDFDDLDFTTPADTDTVRRLVAHLGPIWDVGERFGTIGVSVADGSGDKQKVEVTRHRREAYEPGSRKPVVDFGDDIVEDLARRDLTINAMALQVVDDAGSLCANLVDPFGGAEDLVAGVLRTPSAPDSIVSEDPLRQVRAVRFAARFDMVLADDLVEAIRANEHRLSIVAVERVTDELRKIMVLGGSATATAARLASDLGIGARLFAGLADTEDVFETLDVLDTPAEMLAALAFHGGSAARQAMTAGLKLTNDEVNDAVRVQALVERLAAHSDDLVEARAIVRTHADDVIDTAMRVADAAGVDVTEMTVPVSLARHETPSARDPLPVDGNDALAAGLAGRAVGAALTEVLEAFLSDPSFSRDEALNLLASRAAA